MAWWLRRNLEFLNLKHRKRVSMNWRAFFYAALMMLASRQLVGCGPEKGDALHETSESGHPGEHADEVRSMSEIGVMNVARNEFCVGDTTHTIDTATGSVVWRFSTDNDSSYSKKQARATGRVFHPWGTFLECTASNQVSYNACEIRTPIEAGYTSAAGQHYCCIRKGVFGKYVCRELSTSDAL
jgi:hypothetical protein